MTKEAPQIVLARIDERQKTMSGDITEIKDNIKCFVKDDDEYKNLKSTVKKLWDERNKVVGYILGGGLVGGATSTVLANVVKTAMAAFK